jgi:diphthamide synthase (EF-2-diphthine--ammonia ligase)
LMREMVIVGWSGGKDSALALYEVLKKKSFDALELLTTVTEDYDRVRIHGVRRVLLEEQAESLGFRLKKCLSRKVLPTLNTRGNWLRF